MGPAAGPAVNASAFTKSGLSVYLYASSALTMMAAADPSDTPERYEPLLNLASLQSSPLSMDLFRRGEAGLR